MSGSVITFSYADWSALFPFLATSITSPQAQMFFNLATLVVDNSPCSVFNNQPATSGSPSQLEMILNLTTAHVAQLLGSIDGQNPTTLVGRLSSATKGSVSVSTDLGQLAMSAAWWAQTPQGFMAWTAMAPYRTMHYVPAPQRRNRYGWPA